MVAAHRQMQPLRVGVPSAFNFTNAPPVDGSGISVLLVASDDATLAADAFRHVKVKAVLLAEFQRSLRYSRGVVCGSRAARGARGGRLTFRRKGEGSALFSRPFQ